MSNPIAELSDAIASLVELVGRSVARVDTGRWAGSTGLVWSSEGHIPTVAHALKRSDAGVVLPGNLEVSAAVVGRDPTTDIALLKADAAGLTVPSWAEPQGLRVGQVVLALGWPGKNLRPAWAFSPTWKDAVWGIRGNRSIFCLAVAGI